MSYRSKADENIDEINQSVRLALKFLSEILIEKIEGSNEYKAEYVDKIKRVFVKLLDIEEL